MSQKGSNFERKICRLLTKWASGKPEPMWYWRTAGSGARATRMKVVGSVQAGDVMAIDPRGNFLTDILLIELRDRKKMHPLDFIIGPKGGSNMREWWEEVLGKAVEHGRKFAAAIFHRPGSSHDYIIVEDEFVIYMENYYGEPMMDLIRVPGENANIFHLQGLLQAIPPWDFAWCFGDFSDDVLYQIEENYESPKKRSRKK